MTLIRHKQPVVTNVFIHNANNVYLCGRGKEGHLNPGYPENLAFVALDGAPTVQKGTGGLTCTHADTLYALNESTGYYEAFGPDVPVWANGWLHYYPAATNSQVQSNDLTDVEWTATDITATQDQVGIDGAPNNATHLVHTGAGVGSSVYANVVTAAEGEHCLAVWIKRLSGTGIIDVSIDGGSSFINITSQLVQDEWVKVTYSQALVTNPQLGIGIATIGDEIAVGNFELHLDKTDAEVRGSGPIFTTSAAVSVANPVYILDLANHNDECAYYFELETSLGETETIPGAPSNAHGLFKIRNGVLDRRFDAVTGSLKLQTAINSGWYNYAPNEAGIVTSVGDGTYGYRVKSPSQDAWVADNVAGYTAWDPLATSMQILIFNVSFPHTDYRMRNLRRYDINDYADGKAIIDALMA